MSHCSCLRGRIGHDQFRSITSNMLVVPVRIENLEGWEQLPQQCPSQLLVQGQSCSCGLCPQQSGQRRVWRGLEGAHQAGGTERGKLQCHGTLILVLILADPRAWQRSSKCDGEELFSPSAHTQAQAHRYFSCMCIFIHDLPTPNFAWAKLNWL